MEFKLKLTHNNKTLSLDCVKIKKYMYILSYITNYGTLSRTKIHRRDISFVPPRQ